MMKFIVIGLGRFGGTVAQTLVGLGNEVLGVDRDERVIARRRAGLTRVVQADATDVEALRAIGVRNFDVAVVAISSEVEASLAATLTLKEQGVPHVVAKAGSDRHCRLLVKVGADRVVFPQRDSGLRIAQYLAEPGYLDHIQLSPESSIVEITASGRMIGRTLRQLDLRAKYGVNVVVLRKSGGPLKVSPRADEMIETGDILVVIGNNESIRGLQKLQQ
jgi:trk system potassium uptake protein TrkA